MCVPLRTLAERRRVGRVWSGGQAKLVNLSSRLLVQNKNRKTQRRLSGFLTRRRRDPWSVVPPKAATGLNFNFFSSNRAATHAVAVGRVAKGCYVAVDVLVSVVVVRTNLLKSAGSSTLSARGANQKQKDRPLVAGLRETA